MYVTTILSKIPQEVKWIALALFVVGIIGLLLWKGVRTRGRYVAVLALAEWMFLVLCVTVIFRESGAERGFRLIPFWSYFDYGQNSYLLEMVAEKLLNVALFVPVGFLLGCSTWEMNWRRVLVIGLCLSVSIELLQFVFVKGLCEVDDVIHNVLGCLLGYGMYVTIRKIWNYVV